MKNSKFFLLPISLLLTMSIASCGSPREPGGNSGNSNNTSASSESEIIEVDDGDYIPDPNDETIYFITNDTLDNGTYDDTEEEYVFTINSNYRQIYVNVPNQSIVLELEGVTIENSSNSPVYVQQCENFDISAKNGTVNYIKDTRPIIEVDYSSQGKGAIYVNEGDFKLKGKGTLNITANYYNGVHCKDDVKVQKQTLNITAVNHGIRGNDSVTITSGTINISCGGDGLHSDNSGLSSKGNQKGNVTINGGNLTINSWGDAVQAAYNAIVEQTDSTVAITADFKTNKYSSYEGETVDTSTSSFYLKMDSNTYANGAYTYAAYIGNAWYRASYKGTQSSGGQPPFGAGPTRPGGGGQGGSTYYIYEIEKPNDATSFTLYRFQGNNVTDYTSTYNAVSDAKAFNNDYDMVTISISGSKITFGSWSNYSSGNNNGADISAKGIKADNEIQLKSGDITVEAYDDAIHANNDVTLENGNTPLGNITCSGANLTLKASDDAIHADGTLTISGGTINVTSAYEGLEGNIINVSGGNTYVYATDDGMNATKGTSAAQINVSGGLLDIEVPTSGDTDGIDSNGTLTINGGTVIAKGPGSASSTGSPSAAIDTDGAITITSGSLIVFGGMERSPSSSVTRTLVASSTVQKGNKTISFSSTSYTTTLRSNSNGCVVYSSLGTASLS